MASNSTACCIHIQNEQLEQVDMFPYLGSLITEEGECTTKFRTKLNKGQMIRASLQNLIESMRISCTISIYYRLKLKRSRDSDHATFRDNLSSVGWDLL